MCGESIKSLKDVRITSSLDLNPAENSWALKWNIYGERRPASGEKGGDVSH